MTLYFNGTAGNERYEALSVYPYTDLVELRGNGGDDELVGASFHDNLIYGGSGDDELKGGFELNTIYGGDGNDTIICQVGSFAYLFGGAGDDTIYGGGAGNYLDGGLGADTLRGGSGGDVYIVNSAHDVIIENFEASFVNEPNPKDMVLASVSWALGRNLEDLTLTGTRAINGQGNDLPNTMIGNANDNRLLGNKGGDSLQGADGSDALVGGAGRDKLTGGAGSDIFAFHTRASSTSRDIVIDFNSSEGDQIQLALGAFKALKHTGILLNDQFYAAAGATEARDATDRIIYNTDNGDLYYDVDGSGGTAPIPVATFGRVTHPTLAAADFIIV